MSRDAVMPALVGLLPVLSFLAVLLYLDSYKLMRLRFVIAIVACGVAVAGASYLVNDQVLGRFDIDFKVFTRYVSPILEELLKGLIVFALVRAHRVGFLVDGAIAGFAVGAGFAVVENIYYLYTRSDGGMGTWITRGFGTAIMHGGCTAIFAVATLGLMEKKRLLVAVIPGFVVAFVIHSLYNHFFLTPLLQTVAIAIIFPVILNFVFSSSERAVSDWLGKGFDADTEMLEILDSEQFMDTPIGRYLGELRSKFEGPVVADLLCYLQLYTELAIRAKGILMMRESGFDTPVDEATREKFAEIEYLEGSIGRTGLLALQPLLHMSHKDLWQLYMIGKK
jgi:RsiW-degrading membrane proteinase PrsW (M82 family)